MKKKTNILETTETVSIDYGEALKGRIDHGKGRFTSKFENGLLFVSCGDELILSFSPSELVVGKWTSFQTYGRLNGMRINSQLDVQTNILRMDCFSMPDFFVEVELKTIYFSN